jgi:hypothetical protein
MLGSDQVLEPVLAQVAKLGVGRELVPHKLLGRPRE